MKKNIPTWDLYIEGQEEPILKGVHKNQTNRVIAGLNISGTSYTCVRSKAVKSSRFSKHRKDREQ